MRDGIRVGVWVRMGGRGPVGSQEGEDFLVFGGCEGYFDVSRAVRREGGGAGVCRYGWRGVGGGVWGWVQGCGCVAETVLEPEVQHPCIPGLVEFGALEACFGFFAAGPLVAPAR